MRRHIATSAAALAFALSGFAPALAQPAQHSDQHPSGGGAPQHQEMQHTQVQHTQVQHSMPAQHQQMQHVQAQHTMPVQHSSHAQASHMQVQHQMQQHNQVSHMQSPPHPVGSGHVWHHGDHFTGNRVVINNWSYYHLRQPPSGYEWVQDGDQFILVAVASGIIADIILNSAY